MQLRPYQIDIIQSTIETNASTLIQVPTGGGKTVIAKEIALTLTARDQRVLFIAPKIILMDQTAEVFKGMKPYIVHGNNKYDPNHHILISTIQTAVNRKDLNPDVIIVDEVHHGYTGKNLEELKLTYPNSRIIGLSATPYDTDGVLLKGFDVVLNDYDVDYMIENGYLANIEAFTAVRQNLHNISLDRFGEYDKVELGKLMGNRNAVLEVVNATKERIAKSKKTIVFAVDINHAKLLTEAYKQAGFMANIVHSEQDKQEQKDIIEHFKKGYLKILVSVLMLTTGFDVPDTDTAVIARPTKSQNLYKQMVGRIMRLAQGKTHGTLLDCGNVIQNLGNPTDPITERVKTNESHGKHLCASCGSNKLYPKKDGEKIFWICSVCGYKKEAKEARLYRCNSCKKFHGHSANLHLNEEALTLICECGHHTVISTPQCDEVLVQVFDPKRIELLINRVVQEYKELISQYFDTNVLKSTEIIEHIRKIKNMIKRNPNNFYGLDLKKVISPTNKFIDFNKISEIDVLSMLIENFSDSTNKITLSRIDFLSSFSKAYVNNTSDLKSVSIKLDDSIEENLNKYDDFDSANTNNQLKCANKALEVLFSYQLWKDFFILLSFSNLSAIAKTTMFLNEAEKSSSKKILLEGIYELFNIIFDNSVKRVKNETILKQNKNKTNLDFVKNNTSAVYDFNETVEKILRNLFDSHDFTENMVEYMFDENKILFHADNQLLNEKKLVLDSKFIDHNNSLSELNTGLKIVRKKSPLNIDISSLEVLQELDDLSAFKKYEQNFDFEELKKYKNYESQLNNIIRFQNICKKYIDGRLELYLRKDVHLGKLWAELKNDRSAQSYHYAEIKIYIGLIDLAKNKNEIDMKKQVSKEVAISIKSTPKKQIEVKNDYIEVLKVDCDINKDVNLDNFELSQKDMNNNEERCLKINNHIYNNFDDIVLDAKKYQIWKDSFSLLTIKNLTDIMSIFTKLSKFLVSDEKVKFKSGKYNPKDLAKKIRFELHCVDEECLRIWQSRKDDNSFSESDEYSKFYNEEMKKFILNIEKMIQ